MKQPAVYLISGPRAAGKSTVARLLAARFERGVHLEGDVFRRSIVSGREEMTPDPSPAALEQSSLRHRLAAAAADAYVAAGFGVALEDVVAAPLLGDYRTMIRSRPCHVIVLLPSLEGLVDSAPRVGIWLDTTNLTPEETVEEILAQTSSPASPLVVVDYDEGWPLLFEQLAQPGPQEEPGRGVPGRSARLHGREDGVHHGGLADDRACPRKQEEPLGSGSSRGWGEGGAYLRYRMRATPRDPSFE